MEYLIIVAEVIGSISIFRSGTRGLIHIGRVPPRARHDTLIKERAFPAKVFGCVDERAGGLARGGEFYVLSGCIAIMIQGFAKGFSKLGEVVGFLDEARESFAGEALGGILHVVATA
jgi:hypothetical protein